MKMFDSSSASTNCFRDVPTPMYLPPSPINHDKSNDISRARSSSMFSLSHSPPCLGQIRNAWAAFSVNTAMTNRINSNQTPKGISEVVLYIFWKHFFSTSPFNRCGATSPPSQLWSIICTPPGHHYPSHPVERPCRKAELAIICACLFLSQWTMATSEVMALVQRDTLEMWRWEKTREKWGGEKITIIQRHVLSC